MGGTAKRACLLSASLRSILALVLAFSLLPGAAAAALAGAAQASADEGSTGAPGVSDVPEHYITEIGIYVKPAVGAQIGEVSYSSRTMAGSDVPVARIQERGGMLDFDHFATWEDASQESSTEVTWKIAEPTDAEAAARIAYFDGPTSGVLHAAGVEDGTVKVEATLPGEKTADGNPLVAAFLVEVTGQTDAPFVTGIAICDDAGNAIDPSYRFDKSVPLGTATLDLQARVSGRDPATGAAFEYVCTPSRGLSAASGGVLPDLTWSVNEEGIGVVSTQGVYKPFVTGTNIVYATALGSGFAGASVRAEAKVEYPDDGGNGGWHPQDTLTIRAVRQNAPDTVVAERTFSIGDLESLGTHTSTFTAVGGKDGYFTTTGNGPYFSDVLEAAGINLDDVRHFTFRAYPDTDAVLSYQQLFSEPRYYFPNYDSGGSYSGAVAVAPMIAITSARATQDDPCAPNYDLNDNRRFMLLFGSRMSTEWVSRYQIYCIQTITVVLGDEAAGGGGGGDNGGGGEEEVVVPEITVEQDDPDGGLNHFRPLEAAGGVGGNGAAQEHSGGQDSGQGAVGAQAVGGLRARGQAGGDETSGRVNGAPGMEYGKWSMLQALNRYSSDVDSLLFDNPLAPFAGPLAFAVFAASALFVLARYLYQKRPPDGAGTVG